MANSSYLQYLPPVLWIPDNDPVQTLGRHLRIYEKILTGLSASGLVLRAAAPFASAQLDNILLVDQADAARFAVGDWITIEGTAERRQIDHFTGSTIFLNANMVGGYPVGGTLRIADLIPGQTTFRADNAALLDPGYPLRILQAGTTEDLFVAFASGHFPSLLGYDPNTNSSSFVTFKFGLTNTYSMEMDAVPVKLIDSVTIQRNGNVYSDFEAQIDRLFETFNPWRARRNFLPWLASWVALTQSDDWSEYQKRKLISQMSSIYQQRGLKQGIYKYLDIYAVAAAQPRIVVDEGEAIFHPIFADDGTAVLRAVAHSKTVSPVSDPTKTVTVLLHPTGIAADSANRYFVCDPADMDLPVVNRRPALWRVTPTGEVDYGLVAGLPMPMPIPIYDGPLFHQPCAVTVDATDRVAVLDSGSMQTETTDIGGIYRFGPPAYPITTVIDEGTAPPFPAIHPVDMTLDAAGRFIVLDRGRHPLGDSPDPAVNMQIVVVSEGPLAVATHPLPDVTEPTAILANLADPLERFLIADAGNKNTTTPADIWLADPAAGWSTTSLLGTVPLGDNPLVFPTGMVWESPNVLLVCDYGLRSGFVGNLANRTMAEPPHLYRIDLAQAPPVITRVTAQRQLVHPSKLARDRNGKLLITDRGERMLTGLVQRNWRAGANEFGVIVHFSNQRTTTVSERDQIRRRIVGIIDGELVGETTCWIDF